MEYKIELELHVVDSNSNGVEVEDDELLECIEHHLNSRVVRHDTPQAILFCVEVRKVTRGD